jgi:hypothetical protein
MASAAFASVIMFSVSSAASNSQVANDSSVKKATCQCKNKGECTCAKDKCKCKGCELHKKTMNLVAPLRGQSETTQLPDTAHVDARGGIFI